MIFQYLDAADLYPLAAVSRNLHAWVLPAYLRKRGLGEGTAAIDLCMEKVGKTKPLWDLSALTFSPLQPTSRFSYKFSISRNINAYVIFEFLHHTLRLVHRLPPIESIMLDLGDLLAYYPAQTTTATVWTRLLCALLDATATKAKRLSVYQLNALQNFTPSSPDGYPLLASELAALYSLSSFRIDSEAPKLPLFCDSMGHFGLHK